MAPLAIFETNDERLLFALAKELHSRQYFRSTLSHYQYLILDELLAHDSYELWAQFLRGRCTLHIVRCAFSRDSPVPPEALEDGLKPMVQLALKVRYLIYEKAIDLYYFAPPDLNRPRKCTSNRNTEDVQLIELLDSVPVPSNDAPKTTNAPVRDEEDDYDDEDDGESAPKFPVDAAVALETGPDGNVVLKIEEEVFEVKTKASNMPVADADASDTLGGEPGPLAPTLEEHEQQIINFNKIYHDFEHDKETLIKRRKLEKSDMKLENHNASDGEDAVIPISLGSVSHSMKHLLSVVQERREDIGLNDMELRGLFMDILKNRGKWANDERVGQEELYEACEKVLQDLRGNTEHLTPFLNKVSKREAPNYGLIIKKPMDLNTVMKNLKALAYNLKSEFVDDLMLIWNNCLTYNADPKHYLRAHAIAMQKLTQKLAACIPNITIRSRSELEREDDNENDAATAKPALEGGKASKKGRMRRREDMIKDEDADGVADTVDLQQISVESTPFSPCARLLAPPDCASTVPDDNMDEDDDEAEDGDEDVRDEDADDVQDAELQAWKNLTAKSRAKYCAARTALFDEQYHIVMSAEAVTRELGKMSTFSQFLYSKDYVSKGNKLLDVDEPYLVEYDVAGGIPGLEYEGVDDAAQDQYEQHMVEVLVQQPNAIQGASGLVVPPDRGLNKLYHSNLGDIQEIRRICFKISLIRQMQTQQFVHRSQMRQPEIEALQERDIDAVSWLPNHDINDEHVQFVALRRSVAKMAMHTGFESTEPCAVNTLTQIAERYLSNLARTVKLHMESSSRNRQGLEEILSLLLLENGVDRPEDLYTFVQERVEKNRAKLKDLKARLSAFLRDLLRPSLESFSEKSFEDNSEQFTTGDFTGELGDDFFGFKELGLDKEFKILTSSIPAFLLHLRLQSSLALSGPINKASKYEDLRDWGLRKLAKGDVGAQIGLLRPFYSALAARTEAMYSKLQKRKGASTDLPPAIKLYLIEDDELPQKQRNLRPRLPSTGKIALAKKKLLSTAYIIPEEPETSEGDFSSGTDVPQD